MKEEGVLHNIEFDFVSKSGNIINALFEGVFDYSPEGSFKRTYTTFKDVTQEKQINKIVSNAIINSEEKKGLFLHRNFTTVLDQCYLPLSCS